MRVGQLVVLLKSADWSYILKLKVIVLDVLKLGVVFKLHPAGVRLCHIYSFKAHILKVKNHGLHDDTRWLSSVPHCLFINNWY